MLRMVPLPRAAAGGGWGSHIPSPCGDVVLKSATTYRATAVCTRFPSPCGDVVLKLPTRLAMRSPLPVSVPLRGCGFEILEIKNANIFIIPNVSVPLRGCGFEIIGTYYHNVIKYDMFPSPCGDVVLKFNQTLSTRTHNIVSVPLRGYALFASPVETGEVASSASR